jgi:hypothetical protein
MYPYLEPNPGYFVIPAHDLSDALFGLDTGWRPVLPSFLTGSRSPAARLHIQRALTLGLRIGTMGMQFTETLVCTHAQCADDVAPQIQPLPRDSMTSSMRSARLLH